MRHKRTVLIVEDDHVDAMTIKRAFKDINITNPVRIVANGEEALAYLNDPNNANPCLILLDLNMPRMNGIEFLTARKNHENLTGIPVVVLTTSNEDADKVESFNLGVAGYMLKPVDYLRFLEVIRTIDMYWTLSESPGSQ